MRYPLKRIISHYLHKYAQGIENRTIGEALADFEDNFYVYRSCYYFQLKLYLAYFPPSNIFLLTAEELYSSPQQTL